MPRELSPSEEREYDDYRALGPASEVRSKLGKLRKVQDEAATHRKRVDELEKENGTLKARVPEGAVILTGDDAKAYEAVQAAGGLKEVDDKLKRLTELEQKDARRTREDGLREAGKAEGWDADATVKALSRDAEFRELSFETREIEREIESGGKKEKRKVTAGFVKGQDGKEIPLAEWVAQQADHLLPTLRAANGKQDDGRDYVAQRGRSDQKGGGNVFDRIRSEVKKEVETNNGPSMDTLSKRLGGVSVG